MKPGRGKLLALFVLVGCLAGSNAVTQAHPPSVTVKIVTWNVKDCLKLSDVTARKADFKAMATALDPDIFLVQEVISLPIVEAIRDAAELSNFHVACSNFEQADGPFRNNFEVGIISRFELSQVIEYDPTPDNTDEDPDELLLEPLTKIGIQKVGTARGFLWANIEEIKLTVFVVHLKSSRGRNGFADKSNAEKREFVMAAIAAGVLEDKNLFPGSSFLVGGDFNVGHSDPVKNGTNLKIESFDPSAGLDLYDETHALLRDGLVGSLRMKNLIGHVSTTTFPGFPGSPIDNIYVEEAKPGAFENAAKSNNSFGSDHVPVSTVYTVPAN